MASQGASGNRALRLSVLLPLLALAWVGCSPRSTGPAGGEERAQQRPEASAKKIVVVMRGNPFTLSEAINSAGSGSVPGVDELQDMLHAGLIVEDNRGAFVPRLATQMPTLENGAWVMHPDGRMETTWKLNPGITWHDGTPFTAQDLAFTIAVGQDRRVVIAADPAYQAIGEVATPDALTLHVEWRQTYIAADGLLTRIGQSRLLPLPRHILGAVYEDDPAALTQVPYWTTEFVGLGPFKLHEFFEGSHLVATANDGYFEGRPRISEIQVKFMTDPGAIAATILAGAAELTLGGRYSIEWGIAIRDQWRDGHMESPVPPSWVALFPQMLNPTPAALGNVQFRRALMHAIDRQEMSDTIQAGLSPVAHSIIKPDDPLYPSVQGGIVRYEFDPRRAAQLIEGLGYTRGTDSPYRDSSGQRLQIELRTRQGDDLQEKTLFGVMGAWQRIGVESDPFIFPALRANDREFRNLRPAFEVVRQPSGAEAFIRYHGADTPLPENGFRGINRSRYQNAEFDALVDRYFLTVPKRERDEVAARIVHQMTDQVIVYGIYWAVDPVMIANRLVNVSAPNSTWNAREWDLRSGSS